jgi:hypothetical protein
VSAESDVGDSVGPAEPIMIVDDSVDYSEKGDLIYTYTDDGYIIQSYAITKEEIALAEQLSKLHFDAKPFGNGINHFNLTAHWHEIRGIVNGTPQTYYYRPSTMWTRNDQWPLETTWPSVIWSVSESTTAQNKLSLSVGVTDSVASAAVGSEYTKSHTVSTSYDRTFKVPYMKEGRVLVTYKRPYRIFTCVTTYCWTNSRVCSEVTGLGNAEGAPYNMVATLETKGIIMTIYRG